MLSQAGWKDSAETLENPEDQCELSLRDTCPSPGDLPLSAALELVCPGGLRAGSRTSYIFGFVFPFSSTSQMSGASGVDSAMLLFGPAEAPVSAGARAWHSELEVWALTIS